MTAIFFYIKYNTNSKKKEEKKILKIIKFLRQNNSNDKIKIVFLNEIEINTVGSK